MHRFAVVLAGATLFLLFVGAMVTSTGSGLATPDWPLPDGQLLPPMRGEMFFEHGHRLVAAAVGLLTIVLSVGLILREERRWVRTLGIAALAAVVGQGLLGMLTVKLGLSAVVSIVHAGLSQLFFALIVTLAVVTSRRWLAGPETAQDPKLATRAALLASAIYLQILFGAIYRHTSEALVLHLLGAVVVTVLAVLALGAATGRLRRVAWIVIGLLCGQLLLGAGALTVVSTGVVKQIEAPLFNAVILSLHLVTASAMLAHGMILTLHSFRGFAARSSQLALAEARP